MEITRFFQSTDHQLNIHIKGSTDEPLFQANQIAELLGIVNIQTALVGFVEDEVHMYASGGSRPVLHLTEPGLYRLLAQSRHPVVPEFRKWIAAAVKEIRAKSRYELEAKLSTEATRLQTKTYEDVPKLDHVYICKEAAELHSNRHKIGKALDLKKREAQFNTGSAQGVRMLYKKATHNAPLIENIVEVVMKRYGFAREHYMNRVEHSIDVIDVACTVVDTLASCYETMDRDSLFRKVRDNLNQVHAIPDEVSRNDSAKPAVPAAPGAAAGPVPAPDAAPTARPAVASAPFPASQYGVRERLAACAGWVATSIDFSPLRIRPPGGRRFFTPWLSHDDLVYAFWDDTRYQLPSGACKPDYRDLLEQVMAQEGRTRRELRPRIDGKQPAIPGYSKVALFRPRSS